MSKKPEFKVQSLQNTKIPYCGLVDKHLEYFFASKNNRKILVKTKVLNRRNYILDKDTCKLVDQGNISIHPKFRMRKSQPKPHPCTQFQSLNSKNSLDFTVGKAEFKQFLQKQHRQLTNKTIQVRNKPSDDEQESVQEAVIQRS